MKKWLCIIGLGIAFSAAAAQAADKVGIVNINTIFEQAPQREAAAKRLESEFKGRATELQSMEKDLQAKMQRLQRDAKTMKEADRQKLENEVLTERNKFVSKAEAFENDEHKRQLEERNKILLHIQDAVKQVSEKQGYNLVLDSNAVLYSNAIKDLTADVLKQVK